MNILIDTHIFLWYINGDKQLSKKHKKTIQDINNNIYLSVVSIWEAIIKSTLGKLTIKKPIAEYLNQKRIAHQIDLIELNIENLIHLENLELIHKDPFDRLLLSQAISLNLKFMTDDKIIQKYNLKNVFNY